MIVEYDCPFQLSNCEDHDAADVEPRGNKTLQRDINIAVM